MFSDGSGMRMFYTSRLRPYDLNILALGQSDIAIPPMTRDSVVRGTCPASCTGGMVHPVNVTNAFIHMHYLGT